MKRGFSLIEVMIALGVLSIASVGIMKISTNTAKVQKRAETFQNVLSIEQKINLAVLNPDVCRGSLTSTGPNITANKEIQILDSNNNVLYQRDPGNTIMNGTISIQNIRLVDFTERNTPFLDPISGATLDTGQVFIEVIYAKTARTLGIENNTYTKRAGPIDLVFVDGSKALNNCRSPFNDAVEAAIGQICQQVGGVYNTNTRMCNSSDGAIVNNPRTITDQNPTSVPSILDNRYVARTGDNIVGPDALTVSSPLGITTSTGVPLSVGGALTVASQATFNGALQANQGINLPSGRTICIGSQCIDFQATCANNEYQEGYNPDGSPKCKIIPSSVCGPGQYVVQVDNGVAQCDIIPESAQGVCPPDTILMGYNADGTKDCRANGSVVGKSCEDGQNLEGFDIHGDPICTTDVLDGVLFRSMYENAEGALTFSVPPGTNHDFRLDGRRCRRTRRQCTPARGVVCPSGFQATNIRRYDKRQSAANKECRCSFTCAVNQDEPIQVAFRQCPAINGSWAVNSSYASCNCPSGSLSGTMTISVSCVGARCGGTCDPTTRPNNQQPCTCAPTSCRSGQVLCEVYPGNIVCVPNGSCPSGGGGSIPSI